MLLPRQSIADIQAHLLTVAFPPRIELVKHWLEASSSFRQRIAGQSFDLIVSTLSMHHWRELQQSLSELYRVLRPGGSLLIYDIRFVKASMMETAMAHTHFDGQMVQHTLIHAGPLSLPIYAHFALHKSVEQKREQFV